MSKNVSGRRSRGAQLRRVALVAGLVAGLAPAATAQAALTGSTDVTGTTIAGELSIVAPTPVSLVSKTLTGSALSLDGDLGDWSVGDARGGDGAGWTATAQASPVTTDALGQTALTGATVKLDQPTSLSAGSGGAAPTIETPATATLTGGGSPLVSATANQGVGPWTVSQAGPSDLHVNLPYNAPVSTNYKTTITFTIAPLA
jgi:hypothetical protein